MADTKITGLQTPGAFPVVPSTDVLPIVIVADNSMAASGSTRKVTVNQILGAGGTATLASATISGDLTVDTSTLKVDSANNRVGVLTASPVNTLHINGEVTLPINNLQYWNAYYSGGFKSVAAGYAGYTAFATNGDFVLANTDTSAAGAASALTFYNRYRISNAGIHTWETVGGVAGTAMTLTSTGLGVGTSSIVNGAAGRGNVTIGGSSSAILNLSIGAADTGYVIHDGTSITLANRIAAGSLIFSTNSTERLRIDSSGNVGIGVNPNSLWAIGKVLQIGSTSGSFLYGAGGQLITGVNAYYDTAWKYAANGRANYYQQSSGIHSWFYDSGTQVAGTAANFVQAMTLDASGNLLVGKSVSLFSTVGVEASGTGFISATNSASTNVSTNLSVYSTGAAAFRFYVGLGGTVFATNTTISPISSDIRLKQNIVDFDKGLAEVVALRPRHFEYKSEPNRKLAGFIAQEVESVIPDSIVPTHQDPEMKTYQIDWYPLLVKAIQELNAKVQALEAKLA